MKAVGVSILLTGLLGVSALKASETRDPVEVEAARSPDHDREVKEAIAYLEGWFGRPIALPPIEVLDTDQPSGVDAPGHFEGGVVRLRPNTLRRAPELRRVLRHELAHAAVDQRTKGNCPVWVQEGLAQFLDGTNVVGVESALRRDRLPLVPLLRLEGPFAFTLGAARTREQAYRQSASAVSFLALRIGRPGLLFIVDRLGEGRPFDRALLEAGLSYAELQQAWSATLGSSSSPLPLERKD